jgi:hypothetical protein
MEFRTQIPIQSSNQKIDYDAKILLLGSCFAENIGKKFEYNKFQNTVNPFGIIFNPVSIEKLVNRAIHNYQFTEADIFFHNDLWHCYDVHSELSHPDKEVFLQNLNQILEEMNRQLTESTHIIITYGTSWVYALQSSGVVVANCHKVPQNQFEKVIVSVKDSEIYIQKTIDLIQKVNPTCPIVFTVSPVRHIKDGFIENQRSKAHLITAIHNLQLNYFPSYEILMDELRDYRFYAEDMLHPNQIAIDYIWERFCDSAIDSKCYPVMDEVAAIQKGLAHKPFNPNAESHQKFLNKLQQQISQLQKKFTFMEFY